MIHDAKTYLTSGAQAIPTDGANDIGSNVIDLAVTAPDILKGRPFRVVVDVTTAFTVSASTPTLTIDMYSHTTATVTSRSKLFEVGVLQYNESIEHHVIMMWAPSVGVSALTRYMGIVLVPSSNEFTAGAIRAFLTY